MSSIKSSNDITEHLAVIINGERVDDLKHFVPRSSVLRDFLLRPAPNTSPQSGEYEGAIWANERAEVVEARELFA